MEMMANCLLEMAEKLDRGETPGRAPETPTDARDPPRITQ